MKLFRTLALASAALILTSPAWASPTTITGKDATGATVTLGATDNGAGGPKSPNHALVNTSATPINPATSDNQATEITSLGTIATNSSTQATAANQTAVTGSKAPGTAAASSQLVGGVYNSAGVTLTTGQQAGLQFDASGNLKINVVTGGAGGGAITAASGSYAAGAFAAGSGVDGWNLTEGAKADPAYTSGSGSMVAILKGIYASVNGPIPAGTSVIGHVIADSGSTTAVTALPALPTGTNTIGTALAAATTTGGAAPLVTAALTNTAVAIKASAGSLYKIRCYNPNATVAYVQIYNIASGSVTVGTSTASQIEAIPATSAGGFAMSPVGIAFATAISYAATTTATGSTAPGTALTCSVAYL